MQIFLLDEESKWAFYKRKWKPRLITFGKIIFGVAGFVSVVLSIWRELV